MKTKSLLLIMLAMFVFSACQPSINRYKAEIEDAVRFQLAVCNSVPEFDDWYDLMQWFTEISQLSEDRHIDGRSYREILVDLSVEDEFGQVMLNLYDSVEVLLSKPIEVEPGRMWSFCEINTEINFTFTLIPTQDGNVYYKCEADEEQLAGLIKANFLKQAFNLFDL